MRLGHRCCCRWRNRCNDLKCGNKHQTSLVYRQCSISSKPIVYLIVTLPSKVRNVTIMRGLNHGYCWNGQSCHSTNVLWSGTECSSVKVQSLLEYNICDDASFWVQTARKVTHYYFLNC
ncbi:unnamed protein product [Albugo candida]|uniref:Uncharacterized protein n=1 Tax=Albugo candida TaxID=65357 RepID=A0A024GDT1_9STRA|nr:unnamed protein product [Albugo candida]|eukprot:CCI44888.1 unnamed protein product [Albugo candida]